ncbi:hypothetical protein [Streptomyces sp. NPDC029674]|uniref:hypothetical protein n=1 Tax=Streptomyces sp. NPDC029674 TaxID=3365297 RepID=UPI00384B542B
MGGSTRRPRRRAAGPALRYEHVPGARTSGRATGREGKRVGWRARLRSVGFGCTVAACLVVGSAALIFGPVNWAGQMWHELAPDWPGGGYGFAATTGLFLPLAGAWMIAALFRTNWRKEKARSVLWAVVALPGACGALMAMAIAAQTIRPKHSRRHGSCSAAGEYCWVSSNYPYVWVVGLTATVLGVAGVLGAYDLRNMRRRRRLTAPETAAPSDPPPPDRPTCT